MNQVVAIITEIEQVPRCRFVKAVALLRDGSMTHRVRIEAEPKDAELRAIHELQNIVEGWADCSFGRLVAVAGFYLTPELGDVAIVMQGLAGQTEDTEDDEALVYWSVPRRRLEPVMA